MQQIFLLGTASIKHMLLCGLPGANLCSVLARGGTIALNAVRSMTNVSINVDVVTIISMLLGKGIDEW